jgi:hypothetical protein
MLVTVGSISPLLGVAYTITGGGELVGLGVALLPFASSCIMLLMMSSPAEREREIKLYCRCWIFFTCVGSAAGHVFTDPRGSVYITVACLFSCAVFEFLLKLALPIRRKIASLKPEDLSYYVYNTVFIEGMASLPPMLYLAIESVGCISNNILGQGQEELYARDALEICGGQIVPQFSICTMLALFLFARLMIAPLTKTSITVKQAAEFEGLTVVLKIQILAVSGAVMCNTMLFALMKEGPLTWAVVCLTVASGVALMSAVASEMWGIVQGGTSEDEARGSDAIEIASGASAAKGRAIELVLRSSSSGIGDAGRIGDNSFV